MQALLARTLEIPNPALLIPVGGAAHRGRKAGGGPRAPSHQGRRGRGRISKVLVRYADNGISRPAYKGTSRTGRRLGLSPRPNLLTPCMGNANFTGIVNVPSLSPARVRRGRGGTGQRPRKGQTPSRTIPASLAAGGTQRIEARGNRCPMLAQGNWGAQRGGRWAT